MNLDPHSLQQLIQRIYQQMRCPQCGKRIPVDFASVRMAGDDFMLLQLKCDTCEAYIVLHAALQPLQRIGAVKQEETTVNASSVLHLKDGEVAALRDAIGEAGGSFEKLFKQFGTDASGAKPSIV